MTYFLRWTIVFGIAIFGSIPVSADESRHQEFALKSAQRLNDKRTIPGDAAQWFFPNREIKQLSLDRFWEKPWSEVSRNQSNPIPSMIEFHKMLTHKGIDLVIVPIPAKAVIHPEKFLSGFAFGDAPSLTPFIEQLRSEGLNVVDLEHDFLDPLSNSVDENLYCRSDAHFSPMACVQIADLVAETLERDYGLNRRLNPELVRSDRQEIKIVGDLVQGTEWEGSSGVEDVSVFYVGDRNNPIEPDTNSPVLLLGDSHTMVFSDKDSFHCESAGLFDHLSASMGYPVDLVGASAGGLVQSRVNLYRKVRATPGYWSKKKAVVWVFTSREFTQSNYQRGFISIPIEPKSVKRR